MPRLPSKEPEIPGVLATERSAIDQHSMIDSRRLLVATVVILSRGDLNAWVEFWGLWIE